MNNIIIKNTLSIDNSIKTIVIPYIYKKNNLNLKKYIEYFLEINYKNKVNLNTINEIETKIKTTEINFSIFITINNINYHIFFINILLENEEFDLLNKPYNIIENHSKIGEIIDNIRTKGANLYNDITYNLISEINVGMISNFDDKVNGILNTGFLEGLLLTTYKFNKYKTNKSEKKTTIKKINNIFPKISQEKLKTINFDINKMIKQIDTIFLARDMINEPGNKLSSTKFAKTIISYCNNYKIPVNIEVWNRDKLKKLGMNLLVSVGEGSKPEFQSKLMILHYNPKSKGNKIKNPDYVLMGKGVTFDTGGISLKSGDDTYEMKYDMAGAAVISCFTIGHARINGEESILCMVPLAENNVTNNPTRPGDVITSYNGKTVEIIDTDAEGRLLLADCLAYANKHYPNSTVIDFATLTGAQDEFSCKMFSNVFTRHKELETDIVKASNYIQEQIIAIPYMEKFKKFIESESADIKNISMDCSSDMLTSTAFLGQFIDEDVEWAHIDIAGPSWKVDRDYTPGDASAIGVRLLYELIN